MKKVWNYYPITSGEVKIVVPGYIVLEIPKNMGLPWWISLESKVQFRASETGDYKNIHQIWYLVSVILPLMSGGAFHKIWGERGEFLKIISNFTFPILNNVFHTFQGIIIFTTIFPKNFTSQLIIATTHIFV